MIIRYFSLLYNNLSKMILNTRTENFWKTDLLGTKFVFKRSFKNY